MTENRLDYIDATKGVGILLIMLGHLNTIPNPVFESTNTFKIVIFYVVSGYLLHLRHKEINIRNRIFSLGIPYIIFSVITILLDAIYSLAGHHDTIKVLSDDVLMTVSLRGLSTLWFLPTLFFAELLFYITRKQKYIQTVSLVILPILLLFFGTFFSISDSNVIDYILLTILKSVAAFWFFLVGNRIVDFVVRNTMRSLICVIGSFVCIILSMFGGGVDFNIFKLGKWPITFFLFGSIISCSIIVSMKYMCRIFSLRFVIWSGKHSLFLMLTHLPLPLALIINTLFSKLFVLQGLDFIYYLQWVIRLVMLLILEYFIYRLWEYITRERKIASILKF